MVIVGGDFNAKSPAWGGGDHREDQKGKTLMDMMASLGMAACKPTFTRVYDGGISRSHIDITFVLETESRVVKNWIVSDEYTGSLHSYIILQHFMDAARRPHAGRGKVVMEEV